MDRITVGAPDGSRRMFSEHSKLDSAALFTSKTDKFSGEKGVACLQVAEVCCKMERGCILEARLLRDRARLLTREEGSQWRGLEQCRSFV